MGTTRLAWFLAAALAAGACWSVAPQHAEAQSGWSIDLSGASSAAIGGAGVILFFGLIGAVYTVPTLIWTVADIVSYAQDSPFARGWAIFEIVYGSLGVIGGVMVASVAAGSEGWLAFGLSAIAFSGFNVAHGIWSVVSLDARASSRDYGSVVPFFTPRHDGAVAGVGGQF